MNGATSPSATASGTLTLADNSSLSLIVTFTIPSMLACCPLGDTVHSSAVNVSGASASESSNARNATGTAGVRAGSRNVPSGGSGVPSGKAMT